MANDSDLFTNDEDLGDEEFEEEQREQGPYMPPNQHEHFMTLLDYLEQALDYGSTIPLSSKRLIDYEQCKEIIQNLRENLPTTIQYANAIVEDRVNILREAKESMYAKVQSAGENAEMILRNAQNQAHQTIGDAEMRAEKLIKDAEVRARFMLEQHSITIAAENESREMIAKARADANDIRMNAVSYGESLLLNIERALLKSVDGLRDQRQRIEDESTVDMQDFDL